MLLKRNINKKKIIIGMIHLKDMSYDNRDPQMVDKLYESAKRDLISLQEGGVDGAIVENFFDMPYSTSLDLEQIIRFTNVFTRLKQVSKIPLGVNLQQTDDIEEMKIAHICQGDFIRSESFVETRIGSFGILHPQSKNIVKYKKEKNSNVTILADINVKHTVGIVDQPIEESIKEAKTAGADSLILTGLETGKSPQIEDVKKFKHLAGDIPVLVGSGVNEHNIVDTLEYSDGVIVGSSVKKNGNVVNEVDIEKVKKLVSFVK